MRRQAFFIFLLSLIPFLAKTQELEIGLFAGAANYQGDLAPDIVWRESHPALGVALKHNISPYFAMRYEINYATISANDTNTASLKARNLNFSTKILEFSGQLEFNFFKYAVGLHPKRFTPYVFVGISLFNFDPTTEYAGETYNLKMYSTEGQDVLDGAPKPYNNWQFAIPLGGGFKFNLSENWNLFVHGSYRFTFTDYLDDVGGYYVNKSDLIEKASVISAKLSDRSGEKTGNYIGYPGRMRGNPSTKDQYLFAGVTITRIIPNHICFQWR